MNSRKQTLHTIFAVISLTFFAKFIGFFRDALLGSRLGADIESDAYLMALNSTSIIFVSLGSAIVTAGIPIIVEHITKQNKKEAFSFVNNLLNILVLLSSGLTIVGMFFSKNIMALLANGFEGEKLALTSKLTQIMFPILICISITYVFVSLLQSLNRFKVTSIISFPGNVLSIIFLYYFIKGYGVVGLAVITTIGWVLQFVVQIPTLYKEGYRYRFTMNFKDESIIRFFKMILPITVVAAVAQFNILLDEAQASFLDHGKISYLYYANMLYQAIATTTVLGISAVMFPRFAEKAVKLNNIQYSNFVTSILKSMIFILLPMTTGIILLRIPVIRLVFERGEFIPSATAGTSLAFAFYSLGMLGFGFQDILNKAFYAHHDIWTPVKYAVGVIAVNMILNLMFVTAFDIGGLAVATAAASTFGAVGLILAFRRKTGYFEARNLVKGFTKVLAACVVMGVSVSISLYVLDRFLTDSGILIKLIKVVVPSILGMVIYGVVTVLLKIEEAKYLYKEMILPFLFRKKDRLS
ncbi:MAG: murein biosynthesis integral membrane protein MurJ [Bacillota bacterium]